MSGYRGTSSWGYGCSFASGQRSGGFTNYRTGKYVSAARAHQHTGQSFGGYAKARSSATGNYYMKKG